MGDSLKVSDTTIAPPDTIGHFSDLAQKLLAGQIAERQQQSGVAGNTDNSNITSSPQNPGWTGQWQPGSAANFQWQQAQRPNVDPLQWRPMQIEPPAWSPLNSPGTSFIPQIQQPKLELERIPTLHASQKPNENDRSIYHVNSEEAKIYNDNKDSIVQIVGHGKGQPANSQYSGSGFFVSNHGDIATAYHVINGMESIRVTTADGVEHPAKVVAIRPTTDVAIISIGPGETTKPVTLADSSNTLRRGEPIYSIGHPGGWTQEYLSPGRFISTDTARDVSGPQYIDAQNPNHVFLAVKQNIQGGDSGGPAFDANGKVIGIISRSDHGSHGYMVSVNDLWPVMNKVSDPKQTTSFREADLPFQPHIGFDEILYGGASLANLSQFVGRSSTFQGIGMAGRAVAGGVAGLELWNQDLPFLRTALEHGSTSEKVSAIADVSADALMVGSQLMNFVPRLRAISPAVSLAGSLLKVGNGVAAFRSYS